ncbi:DUF218 domain-containing protein [Jannaschia faecimaris]|uniref:DUF218 domain-containing protein n=1 Tax=Jannaschia faecimaris TaxID=1244108 RepID=A0A1H3SYH1_9RHOB|nr:YdcF family protein [Jannaschia faecimaris]SDZ43076.1 DUF218 domain-containing protein [Jannaschia faecimaris]
MTTAMILGCAVLPDGNPSPTFELRIRHAFELYRSGRVSRVCVTGGLGRYGPPEAHVAYDRLLALGVRSNDILVEDTSINTIQNLTHAFPLVSDGPVILVSNRWHLPRARLVAWIIGMPVSVSGPQGTVPLKSTMAAILREVAATPFTVVRAVRWARRNAR